MRLAPVLLVSSGSMTRIPIQIAVSINRTRPAPDAPTTGSTGPPLSDPPTEPRRTVEAQLDTSWQPGMPRISFVDGPPDLGILGLPWLSDHIDYEPAGQLDDDFADDLARAIESGREVVLAIRRVSV